MAAHKNALVHIARPAATEASPAERERRIQEKAYHKALERNFAPGHELDDWLAAEDELDEELRRTPEI